MGGDKARDPVEAERSAPGRKATSEELTGDGPKQAGRQLYTGDPAKVAPAFCLTEELLERRGWKGTPPAEGTRRLAILRTIEGMDVLSSTEAVEFADAIEAMLISCEAAQTEDAGRKPDFKLQRGYVDAGSELDRISIPRARDAEGVYSLQERVPRLVEDHIGATEKLRDREAELEEVTESADRYHEQREQARAGEGRFKEERDAAFSLLRWLLPVTVARPLDEIGEDD
jgi:hypothetical protein